jgi:hypothetical protein
LEEIKGTVSLCCLSRSLGLTGDGFFDSMKIIGRRGGKGELKVLTLGREGLVVEAKEA